MLFLAFELDGNRYALDSRQLIEVLPWLNLRPISKAPACIAGMFDYHGLPVPVVDLSVIIAGRAAHFRMNTRVVVVNYAAADDAPRTLGLIVERATSTVRLEPGQFKETGVSSGEMPYLGPIARDAEGLIQWVTLPQLLPLAVRNVLFQN